MTVNGTNSAHCFSLSALSLQISALSMALSATPGVKMTLNQAGGTKITQTVAIFIFLVNIVAIIAAVAVVFHFN